MGSEYIPLHSLLLYTYHSDLDALQGKRNSYRTSLPNLTLQGFEPSLIFD